MMAALFRLSLIWMSLYLTNSKSEYFSQMNQSCEYSYQCDYYSQCCKDRQCVYKDTGIGCQCYVNDNVCQRGQCCSTENKCIQEEMQGCQCYSNTDCLSSCCIEQKCEAFRENYCSCYSGSDCTSGCCFNGFCSNDGKCKRIKNIWLGIVIFYSIVAFVLIFLCILATCCGVCECVLCCCRETTAERRRLHRLRNIPQVLYSKVSTEPVENYAQGYPEQKPLEEQQRDRHAESQDDQRVVRFQSLSSAETGSIRRRF